MSPIALEQMPLPGALEMEQELSSAASEDDVAHGVRDVTGAVVQSVGADATVRVQRL